ncbi:hypothetical protein [Chryseobacterium echinoideorum]|uniref:hypothetical protein n=1 Tax=Chryseobacterium echinoideorum TaxID=1549648 RepID=UPI001184E4C9|nr:hypothetical protein [Chryseobacterium echinoideorum]
MKVYKLISNKSNVLYDGIAENIAENYKVTIGKDEIIFNVSELERNKFKNIKTMLSDEDFNTIVEFGEFKNNIPDYIKNYLSKDDYEKVKNTSDYYRAENHLSLNYLIKDNYLLLFTYGEKQPSRWIIVLEGIWEIKVLKVL